MAFTNFDTREINCKVIYFGARGSGKTENLRALFRLTSPEVRAGILDLEAEPGSSTYFEFLPLSLGQVRDFSLKLHLFTLPTHTDFRLLQQVILRGVDGCVLVADSRRQALAETIEAMRSAATLLSDAGYQPETIPTVIQYNHRDDPTAVPLEIMRDELNPRGRAEVEAVAHEQRGVLETIELVVSELLQAVGEATYDLQGRPSEARDSGELAGVDV